MKIARNKGFSLVEMLLTVMVVTGLLVAVFDLLEDYAEKELALATADYMENIALAVQDIVENPTYFQDVYALADAAPGDTLELSFTDLIEGFATIPASTRLNESMRTRNPMGAEIAILLRIADDPVDPTDAQAFDIVVATSERIIDERLRRAATASGPYGGLIRETGDPIRSAFAGWEMPLGDFSGTAWASAVAAAPASIDEGGYLVHYRHINFEDIAGDYMFRVAIPGRPDLNRMYTTLDMGSNNIMGTDNMQVVQDLGLSGQALVDGNMRVGGTTAINQGDVFAGNRFTAAHAVVNGTGGGATGNFIVDDSIAIGQLNLTGQLNAADTTFTGGLVQNADMISTSTLHLHGGIGGANRIQATALYGNAASGPNIQLNGQLAAADLAAESLTVSGTTGVVDMIVGGSADISGNITTEDIDTQRLSVDTFGNCDRGC